MLYIGNHTSSSRGYLAMGKQMLANGGNTFAFFTRNPRGGKAKDIDPQDVQAFGQLAEENHFGKLVAHAPYTMNCCAAKENLRDFAREIMADDLRRLEMTPGNYYNFHPGSHVGQGAEVGISKIAEILNEVLTKDQSTIVLLETMSGKGTEVGRNFEELRQIIDRVELKDKLGVCLDTCHVWDGGYDIVSIILPQREFRLFWRHQMTMRDGLMRLRCSEMSINISVRIRKINWGVLTSCKCKSKE